MRFVIVLGIVSLLGVVMEDCKLCRGMGFRVIGCEVRDCVCSLPVVAVDEMARVEEVIVDKNGGMEC